MRKLTITACLAIAGLQAAAQAGPDFLPGYNRAMYPSVHAAAVGVGAPFLMAQGYMALPAGVSLSDSTFTSNGVTCQVHERYINPVGADTAMYYVHAVQYAGLGIDNFKNVWPRRAPNAFYNAQDRTFFSQIDCVGYGSRLLSATGDTSATGNAYRNLANAVRSNGSATFASNGWVCSAYEVAAGFPVLPGAGSVGNLGPHWEYVAGNVNADSITRYNRKNNPAMKKYTGKPRPGFDQARPGDILAFGYGPHGGDNGHFMVIDQPPHLLNADSLNNYFQWQQPVDSVKKLVSNYNVFAVPLYDCSGTTAHFYDSRQNKPDGAISGIGHGTLLLLCSRSNNTPMGFIFSLGSVRPGGQRGGGIVYIPSLTDYTIGGQRGDIYAISVGRFVP